MKKEIYTIDDVVELIKQDKILSLAANEDVLENLPKGNWVGGTTPYFMSKKTGGQFNNEDIYVNTLSDTMEDFKIEIYDEYNFDEISENIYGNGYTLFIIPTFTEIHEYYAINNWQIRNLYKNPFIGWVAGFDLNAEDASPKVFNGLTSKKYGDKAIAIHVKLPENKKAGLNIVNIFDINKDIEFANTGFSVTDCIINGKNTNFAEYLLSNNIDIKLPIIANYSGIKINVSIKSIDQENKKVFFYAPVFKNRKYFFSKEIENYTKEFKIKVPKLYSQTEFSCNCILNYLYGELENNKVSIGGPITFGEIAYSLLNQTLVYMTINDN